MSSGSGVITHRDNVTIIHGVDDTDNDADEIEDVVEVKRVRKSQKSDVYF